MAFRLPCCHVASVERESADLLERLERIKRPTEHLFQAQGNTDDARRLADKISAEIAAARARLKPIS